MTYAFTCRLSGKRSQLKKLADYLNDPKVREEHGIDKAVSLTTARRYLDELGYRSVFMEISIFLLSHQGINQIHVS
jgi:hypothetical protein